jgi:hypothetical protein
MTVSHGFRLGSLVKRDGDKLPSFLASESLEVMVLSGDLKYNRMCFGGNCAMCQVYNGMCFGGNHVMHQVDLVLVSSRCPLGKKLVSYVFSSGKTKS